MCLGLGSFCLAVCAYSDGSGFVPGKAGLQMLSVYLRSPYGCGFGCAMALKERSETCPYGSLSLGSFCLAACAYYDYSEIVPGKIGLQMLSVD